MRRQIPWQITDTAVQECCLTCDNENQRGAEILKIRTGSPGEKIQKEKNGSGCVLYGLLSYNQGKRKTFNYIL